MKICALILALIAICACQDQAVSRPVLSASDTKLDAFIEGVDCPEGDGSEKRPCNVSYLRLLAVPERFNGKWISIIAYSPGMRTRAVFPSKDQFEYGDTNSSLLVVKNKEKIPVESGYIQLRALFKYDRSDAGLAAGLYRQFGLLDNLESVVAVSPFAERFDKCKVSDCTIEYVDGVLPVTTLGEGREP